MRTRVDGGLAVLLGARQERVQKRLSLHCRAWSRPSTEQYPMPLKTFTCTPARALCCSGVAPAQRVTTAAQSI